MKSELIQELSDAIARDVRITTLSAETAFRRIGVAEAFQNQTTQALNLAQTQYKLGLSSIVEVSHAQLQKYRKCNHAGRMLRFILKRH